MKQLLTAILVCLLTNFASAESRSAKEGSASASLNFKVIIPSVIEVRSYIHPAVTSMDENKEELQITHNLARLCLTAELNVYDPAWVITVEDGNWEVMRQTNSYSICTFRRGKVELKMNHTFSHHDQPWPIRLTLNPV